MSCPRHRLLPKSMSIRILAIGSTVTAMIDRAGVMRLRPGTTTGDTVTITIGIGMTIGVGSVSVAITIVERLTKSKAGACLEAGSGFWFQSNGSGFFRTTRQ